jgi:hypothetical protein
MNSFFDGSLVGLAVLASAGYALTSLGPKSVRRRLLAVLSGAAAHAPAFLGLSRTAQRLKVAAAGEAKGACGGCDSCGEEQAAQKSPEAEVRVPVAKIGRRG